MASYQSVVPEIWGALQKETPTLCFKQARETGHKGQHG